MNLNTVVGAMPVGGHRTEENARRLKALMLATSAMVWIAAAADARAESPASRLAAERAGEAAQDVPATPVLVAQGVVAQAAAEQSYAIPAGPLAPALNRFADESGLQLIYSAELAENARTRGIQGSYTPEQALRLLLAGSGIAYSFAGADTVTLTSATAQSDNGPVQLGPVTVEGELEGPFGPVEGYNASRTTTGSKTDTPLIEIPQSISVITRDRLDDQGAESISDALRYTPGFFGEAFGNDSRVDFLRYRGFDEGGVGTFQDGLQLRSSGFAEYKPELYGAQRVEVLRGPASVLYGQSGPGGLVNIATKRPPSELLAEVAVEGGNFDRLEGRFDIGGPVFGGDSAFFRLTGLAREAETQVDFVDDDRRFIAPAFTWKPREDTSITLLASFQDDKTGSTNQFLPRVGTVDSNPNGTISTSRLTGEPDFDRFDRTTYSLGYLFEHEINDSITIRQNARYNDLHSDTETFFGVDFADVNQSTLARVPFVVDSSAESFGVDTHAQFEFASDFVEQKILAGFDFQYYNFDERQRTGEAFLGSPTLSLINLFDPVYGTPIDVSAIPTTANAKIVQEQYGVYLQNQVTIDENLIVSLGGRVDFVSSDEKNRFDNTRTKQDDAEFSGRIGAVYLTDLGLAPYINYAESFTPVIGLAADGEPFDPETGEQIEAGVKYQPPGTNSSVTLAAFQITRQNVITPATGVPGSVQTGEVRSRGIELEGVASLDFGLDLIAGYTFQNVEVTESNRANEEGNRPAGIPAHLASLWAFYTFQDGPLKGLGLGGGARYKGETQGDSRNTFTVDDFLLFDAAARYEWQNFSFAVNATNIFDNRHVASCSADFFCFYGQDQTITASLQFSW